MRDRAAAGCPRLQDGINNDALLIDDCNGNPAPHHWCARYAPAPSSSPIWSPYRRAPRRLGDGYCDDGTDADDGGLDCTPRICLLLAAPVPLDSPCVC